jgi:hypothetical protein
MPNSQGYLKPMALCTMALFAGAAAISSAATQFVAYRVGYPPAIGAPLFGHIYAPWRWMEWQHAAWAAAARRTFQIVDVGLFPRHVLAHPTKHDSGLAYHA